MRIRKLFGVLVVSLATGPALAQAPGSVERGRYLVETVMACGNCHTPKGPQGQPLFDKGLSGGFVIPEPMFRAVMPNITMDPETGIGKWTDAQIARAIREGIRPDGTVIGPPMPIANYRHLSDDDVKAVVAYLRAQPPVKNKVEKSTYNMPLPPNYGPPLGRVTAPSPADNVAYGRYLAEAAHCMECHTPRGPNGQLLMAKAGAGGQVFKGPWGESVSRNLTPHETGLKGWTDAQVIAAVRTGKSPQGALYKPPMAFEWYRGISDADMAAIVAYLRSLPALPLGQ